ncbi:TonB-dependent receptor [Roseivirga sp.]|uniref:TonB-dependent receptor n=1 Tax=Roseivirga sp. TaxID=1964215 RepID=UPI003B8DDD92
MLKSKICLTLFLSLIAGQLFSQDLIIKDDLLEPLSGATILLLPDSTVLTSDQNGRVSISKTETNQVTISFVGFTTKRVYLTKRAQQVVVLERSEQNLNDVVVEGFLGNVPLEKQAGSIARISSSGLRRFDEQSLVNAVNTIPGVRFEQRAAASYRVSIRGSSIRSPFGVRNVKVYWNGIPFTEPGGNTFLNLLDLTNASSLEIIKGPAASIYGAGNGGVIKIQSTNLSELANASTFNATVGSYGMVKLNGASNFLNENSSLTFKWSSQKSDGYREHNAMDRNTLELDGLFFPNEKRTISTSLLYSDLFYEIPGGLNPDQRDENPRQSRPNSIERNASVANELFLFRVGQEYVMENGWKNTTDISLSASKFENPFILDFKKDNQQVFSGRTLFEKELTISGKPANWSSGMEYQRSFFDGKNFGNVNGEADTIRFADQIDSKQSILFTNLSYDVNEGLNITAGLSRNSLSYDIDRTIDKINNNPQGLLKEFDAVWSPRLAISKRLGTDFSVHFSVMSGFSPPTTTEVRTNEGSLNSALQAEKGLNYEFNFRGAALNNKLSFDLALFYFQLQDAITTFTDMNGVVLFRNAGETQQRGAELSAKMNWIKDGGSAIANLSSTIAYTYHNFEFEDYIDDGDDFSGNALPGTAPHVVNIQTDISFRNGLYANLTYHYSDPIPLNDSNTFFSNAYNLMNLRIGYQGAFKDGSQFEVFAGIDNLLDVSYSLGNDLNAFGRRYFQPAAEQNYYFGIKLKLNN